MRACGRAGSYRKDGLTRAVRADIALPDLLVDLASCDRRRDFDSPTSCGARFLTWSITIALASILVATLPRRSSQRGRLNRLGL